MQQRTAFGIEAVIRGLPRILLVVPLLLALPGLLESALSPGDRKSVV